jgi:hypothetical protein
MYSLHNLYNYRAVSIPAKSFESILFFLDSFFRFRQSNITNEPYKRFGWLPREVSSEVRLLAPERFASMHDFLIALVFVAMVASPAILVSSPKPVRNRDR